MHFQLVSIFIVRVSFPIEVTNAHDLFERLRAHRARVHP